MYSPPPQQAGPSPQQAYGGQPGGQPGYGASGYNGYAQGYAQPGYGAALPPETAPLPGASMGEAVRRFFQRYAQFRGCASPSEFWWAYLAQFLLLSAVAIVISIVGGVMVASAASSGSSGDEAVGAAVIIAMILWVIFGILSLGLLVPQIAVGVRRLHDAGYSGLFWLLALVPGGNIALIVLWCMPSRPERFRPEWA